jgi:hypothetical protein
MRPKGRERWQRFSRLALIEKDQSETSCCQRRSPIALWDVVGQIDPHSQQMRKTTATIGKFCCSAHARYVVCSKNARTARLGNLGRIASHQERLAANSGASATALATGISA